MPNGFCLIQIPFYGFVANVSISHDTHMHSMRPRLMGFRFLQRARAKPSFGTVKSSILMLKRTDDICQFYNYPGDRRNEESRSGVLCFFLL